MRLQEIPVPSIGADDVLIRMRATSVNTPDWAAVTGVPYILRLSAGLRRPKRPIRGSDVAGVVEAVGPRVTDLSPGDEVVGSTRARAGAFAEYVVAPAAQLVKKPAGLAFTDAAASVTTGLAALVAIRDMAQVGAGTRVLINGASGGVGTMAVQIAKVLGANVTGVCGSRNVELVRSLGADHLIDYTTEDVTQSQQLFDVILDNVLNHPSKALARLLAPGGVLIPNSIGYTGGLLAGLPRTARAVLRGLGSINVRLVTPAVNHENLDALLQLLESGKIRVVIDKIYPLDQAASAVTHMLQHHANGKIVVAA
ncbi:NAD(P)-dependent alcohol dehydrogenase [Pseudofrankia sp. BMG5.36]|uniref:NAD(P)-dependent alcohol dehydrogenase n=1 Tax=Pseudofrankia sp. BMG5.36 TaxID=1834512 RepID=UPI00237957FB|nr:NAD(P)-dependent alcohol dehydrogenase [Pseudofrankia sp. BMG5.36]